MGHSTGGAMACLAPWRSSNKSKGERRPHAVMDAQQSKGGQLALLQADHGTARTARRATSTRAGRPLGARDALGGRGRGSQGRLGDVIRVGIHATRASWHLSIETLVEVFRVGITASTLTTRPTRSS